MEDGYFKYSYATVQMPASRDKRRYELSHFVVAHSKNILSSEFFDELVEGISSLPLHRYVVQFLLVMINNASAQHV